ncbi:atherin-like, partial [Onychostruthus taczanowskii]|uniref:atherin-like n=1 Tax=Onychostruthus taczanowskii TaxID=356909 RepID=UPI001B7FF6D4
PSSESPVGKAITGSNGLRGKRHRAPPLPSAGASPRRPQDGPSGALCPQRAGATPAPSRIAGRAEPVPRASAGATACWSPANAVAPGRQRSRRSEQPFRNSRDAQPPRGRLTAPCGLCAAVPERSALSAADGDAPPPPPARSRPERSALSAADGDAPPPPPLPCPCRPCPPRRPLPSALPRSRPAGGRAARTRVPAPSRTHPPPCTCCPRHRGWGGPGRAEPHVGLTSALMQPRRRGGAEEMASVGPPSASGRGGRRSRARSPSRALGVR